jgi:hypothetical protein
MIIRQNECLSELTLTLFCSTTSFLGGVTQTATTARTAAATTGAAAVVTAAGGLAGLLGAAAYMLL